MSNDSDLDLSRRLAAGEPAVMTEILARFGARVLGRLNCRWPNDPDLEDALFIGLRRVWEARDRYDPALSSLGGWFYRLARNALMDAIRERLREPIGVEDLDEVTVAGIANQAPEVEGPSAASRRRLRRLRAIIAAMSPRDRDIVRAWKRNHESGEWSTVVAKKHGMTPKDVRTRFVRLKNHIRDELNLFFPKGAE